MIKTKIGISLIAQFILGLVGSISLTIMLPYQSGVAGWILITALGVIQVLIMPIVLLFNLDFTFESYQAGSIMMLAVLSLISLGWWIFIMVKSKKNWLVAMPIAAWVVIGTIATYAVRTSI